MSIFFSNLPSIILCLFFLINLPFSVICQYEENACSQPFYCGFINNVSYPFWAQNQPAYCGHPGFQLDCEDDTPLFYIMKQKYHVLGIIPENQTLMLARTDTWKKNNCPEGVSNQNTTLNQTLFNFPPSVNRNLTLFYGCPALPPTLPNTFQCQISGTTGGAWISNDTNLMNRHKELLRCNTTIVVPVLGTAFSSFNPVGLKLEDFLKVGFEVKYSVDMLGCDGCKKSGGHCGFNRTTNAFICLCGDRTSILRCAPDKEVTRVKILIGVITVVVLAILLAVIILVLCCCFKMTSIISKIFGKKKERQAQTSEAFFRDCQLLTLKKYKYTDVRRMTNYFKDKIGQGGFGSVFKGKLPDGQMVAVKILSETKGNGIDFISEVASISRTSHINIVSLVGFCIEGSKRALVYEFMPNGSLEKFIYDKRPSETQRHLGWEALYKIAVGIARGLEYLHGGCNTRIVHFDIKPHNILLDQNFIPKIADFGLSKLCRVEHSIVSMTGARGTAGYIAPELVSRNIGEVSHKSDVYSYGMMVLEIVGGRKNLDARLSNISEIYFPHWIYKRLDLNEDLGLHGIASVEEHELARKMIIVGLWCVQIKPTSRPPMSKVLQMLEGSLETLQVPPAPFLSSPPNEYAGSLSNTSTM